MNTLKPQVKRVLIFEHPLAIPTVAMHLADIEKTTDEHFELIFAISIAEAQERLPHADIAIIEAEGKKCEIAKMALKLGIPMIVTSLFFKPYYDVIETERLKLINKPHYFGFKDAVKQLLQSIAAEESQILFTA
jgi:hypothetical protein